jgi:hypothetical protein
MCTLATEPLLTEDNGPDELESSGLTAASAPPNPGGRVAAILSFD